MVVIGLIVALLAVAILGGMGAIVFTRPKDNTGYHQGDTTITQVLLGGVVPTVCVILILVTLGLWIGLNVSTRGEVASLEAFYYETLASYEYTAGRTGTIEISAAQPGLIDVAYMGQAEIVGMRLVELRNEVAHYNRRIRWYHAFADMPFASPFLAEVPDELHLITITDLDALRDQVGELLDGD